MAATGTYFFESHNGFCVGYHMQDLNREALPAGVDITEVTTTHDPNRYIGLDKAQLTVANPDFPDADPTDRESVSWRRGELYRLYYEIQFTTELGEDTTALQAEYDTKKADYLALTTP